MFCVIHIKIDKAFKTGDEVCKLPDEMKPDFSVGSAFLGEGATSAKKRIISVEIRVIRVIRVHKCPDGEKAWKTQKIEWICEM